MFGPDIPVTDADTLRHTDTPHAATTMLRITPDGDLAHIRHGARDQAHGSDPNRFLQHLRETATR
ncbi:hypothetical protein [Kitasatospora griseola]|nr:hypothetical protein [Kitasatospora griseola]